MSDNSPALPLHRFASLPVVHAVTTRLGGVSRGPFAALNLGHTVGDDPEAVAANHARLYGALVVQAEQVVTAQQVHGNAVRIVGAQDGGQTIPATDGLITDDPGLLLMMRFADCVPVLFYGPDRQVVGLAHAGWRGTVQRVAARVAQTMIDTFGCRAGDLRVGIGPSIGPCCYEVGPEVIHAAETAFAGADGLVTRRQPDGRGHLDLWQANARQLRELGIRQIEVAEVCTRCHRDRFFSHRGDHGRTGRLAAVISLRQDGV